MINNTEKSIFASQDILTSRVIYTPSAFARESLLYLQETGSLTSLQTHRTGRQNLDSYLVFTVASGSGTVSYASTEEKLSPGDCVFIDCRTPYYHESDPHDFWTLQWVHFNGLCMPGIYEKYKERGGRPVFRASDSQQYITLLSSLYNVASSDSYVRDMEINSILSRLLTFLMIDAWDSNRHQPDSRGRSAALNLESVRQYIFSNYTDRITLGSLAENFFVNKYHLTKTFKEKYGITIQQYLQSMRVNKAKHLLRFTDEPIEQIGLDTGIGEAHYFIRVFKKVEGMTPGEFRKLWSSTSVSSPSGDQEQK